MEITLPIFSLFEKVPFKRERFIIFLRGVEITGDECIELLSHTHRVIIITRGLSRREQTTNDFRFTSIGEF